jgi:hypothetical protein
MEPMFERIFSEPQAMRPWFANFIMYSAALTAAGCNVPFTDLGAAVMKMLADTRGIRADGVEQHKPSRQAYAYVEREPGAEPSQFCMIACHTWDTLGAVAAGRQAALIKPVGNDVLGVGPQPQIVANNLNNVADQLIAWHNAMAAS